MLSRQFATESSAAFADLGTFLPFFIGLVFIAGVDPVGLLFGFGCFALYTALYYRRPIPVQPMKAVGAMVVAGLISTDVMAATGVLMGLVLLALSHTDWIEQIKQRVPKTLLYGMRAALALSLVVAAASYGAPSVAGIGLLLALLVLLQYTPLRSLSCILVVLIGVWLFGDTAAAGDWSYAFTLPSLSFPSLDAFTQASILALAPQLALTLTNALILTAVIAAEYFPNEQAKLTERRFARTSGVGNLLLAPLGAIPMCHGAGGLAAHHAFGARTGWAVALFGLICLLSAGLFAAPVVDLMRMVPAEVIITLVLYAAWVLADPIAMTRLKPHCLGVIALMVPVALAWGLIYGLIIGFAAEWIYQRFLAKRLRYEP